MHVDKSASLDHCDNTNVDPIVTQAGNRIVNVPVDLGVFRVSSNLRSTIKFPEPVMEIKDVKKKVEIVQCRLMTSNQAIRSDLLVRMVQNSHCYYQGYVSKNIQYATVHVSRFGFDGSCVSSDIKSLTVRIPFKCMTTLH